MLSGLGGLRKGGVPGEARAVKSRCGGALVGCRLSEKMGHRDDTLCEDCGDRNGDCRLCRQLRMAESGGERRDVAVRRPARVDSDLAAVVVVVGFGGVAVVWERGAGRCARAIHMESGQRAGRAAVGQRGI